MKPLKKAIIRTGQPRRLTPWVFFLPLAVLVVTGILAHQNQWHPAWIAILPMLTCLLLGLTGFGGVRAKQRRQMRRMR